MNDMVTSMKVNIVMNLTLFVLVDFGDIVTWLPKTFIYDSVGNPCQTKRFEKGDAVLHIATWWLQEKRLLTHLN